MVNWLLICLILISCLEESCGSSVSRHMWITPIQIYSFFSESAEISDTIIDKSLISSWVNLIKEDFERFKSNSTLVSFYKIKQDLIDAASFSDVYYFYQQDMFSDSRNRQYYCVNDELFEVYAMLKVIIKKLVLQFLKDCYIQEDRLKRYENGLSEKSVFIWASIHSNGTYHQAHHHQNSVISGVLYLSIPESSGAIVFDDPRGAHPPFGKTLRIDPQVGDMVLFPGWLVHSVAPTPSINPRISLSFNVDGDWETTSDFNLGFFT